MNIREIFSGLLRDNRTGAISTTRTVYLGAFIVASTCILFVTFVMRALTEWMMGAYLGAFVTGALGSKGINAAAAVKGSPVPKQDDAP